MTYLLFVLVILFAVFCYLFLNKDCMRPSLLMCIGYILSLISLIYNSQYFDIEIHLLTFCVIISGIVFFILGDLFSSFLFKKQRKDGNVRNCINDDGIALKQITISKVFVIVETIVGIVIIYFYYKEIYRIALSTPGVELYGITWAFRNSTDEAVNTMIVQLSRVVSSFSFIFLYIIINNYLCKKNLVRFLAQNFLYLLPVSLTVVLSILKGGRIQLIALVVFCVCIYYLLWRKKTDWKKNPNLSTLLICFVLLVVFLFGFYAMRKLVGRVENHSSFIDYITYYLGDGIKNLDLYLSEGFGDLNNPPFTETFYGMIRTFAKMGFQTPAYQSMFPHLTVNGYQTGNVYTNLRRFYNDFGYFGVIGCQFLFGFLFGMLYTRIKYIRELTAKNCALTILYASWIYVVLIQSVEDNFFHILSGGIIIEIVIQMSLVYFIFGIKWKYIFDGGHSAHSRNATNRPGK